MGNVQITKSEVKRTVYLLGQVYGCITDLIDGYTTPTRLQYAYCYPLNAVAQAYIAVVRDKKLQKKSEEYIAERLNDISADFVEAQPIHSNELHGIFAIGMHHAKRPIETVIDATGLTQAKIAEITGDTVQTVGRWYRGEFQIPEKKRYQIEKILFDKSIEI